MTVTYITSDNTTVSGPHETEYQPQKGDTVQIFVNNEWVTALIRHVHVNHDTSGKTMVSATINKSSNELA